MLFRLTISLFIYAFSVFGGLEIVEQVDFDDLLLSSRPIAFDQDLIAIKQQLFKKLNECCLADVPRMMEHQMRALQLDNKSMHYSFDIIGGKPAQGYPLYIALHGGGGAEPWLNDSQWHSMQEYYKSSISCGIYIATRGITNTWDLHFTDQSYPLYEHLIENMVLFENVDPNRIYILGFSAGGDGVYQIASRMASRWAAANMSAGHSNSINLSNLRNTPFLMQMGENDASYGRNQNVVENTIKLNELGKQYGGYPHALFLHRLGTHNSWRDNDSSGAAQEIIKDPISWLKSGNSATYWEDTNAIHWLNKYERNPYPQKLIWNSTTSTSLGDSAALHYLTTSEAKAQMGAYRRLFYWLDLNNNPPDKELGQIVANYDRSSIHVEAIEEGVNLKILLNQAMVDFSKPLSLSVKGEVVGEIALMPHLEIMTRTLLERSDPNFCFEAEVELYFDENWKIRSPS